MVSYSEAHKVFDYEERTGALRWKTNRGWVKAGDIAGGVDSHGYVVICYKGRIYKAHRLAFMMHYGFWPENEIDHINHDKTDNRIKNLREVSRSCNAMNLARCQANNKTGVSGVHKCHDNGQWMAKIKGRYIGRFNDFVDAVKARFEAEKEDGWAGCQKESSAYKYLVADNIEMK